jgi:hypothetical protein
MEALLIKEQLHSVVESGDEKLLHLMYALASAYNKEPQDEFTDSELLEFRRRRENHLNGSSKSYSWSKAKAIITNCKVNV